MRLFVDMDGTLAETGLSNGDKFTYTPGYFTRLPPYAGAAAGIAKFAERNPDVPVYILTSAAEDSRSILEKHEWLDRYLPFIPKSRRIIVLPPVCKIAVLGERLAPDDVLWDDYGRNCEIWEKLGGTAVKCLNGYNKKRCGPNLPCTIQAREIALAFTYVFDQLR
jgi:5'(3')-deoxyribonucleotidase